MRTESSKRLVAVLASVCVAVLLAAVGSVTAFGQGAVGAKPVVEKKVRAKPRGRLPAYYGQVVSAGQREQIYSIQAKYADEIEKVEKQLVALRQRRDAEVEAVLSPEQQAKVTEAREAAAAKRKVAREAKATAENRPAGS